MKIADRLRRQAIAARNTTAPPECAPEVDWDDALEAADALDAAEKALISCRSWLDYCHKRTGIFEPDIFNRADGESRVVLAKLRGEA